VTSMATAHYSVLEVCWPGAQAENAGVLLVDPDSGRAQVRLRRDWEKLIEEDEDREVWELLQDDLNAKLAELGPDGLLAQLEDSLSGVLRISEREPVAVDEFDRTLNRLYRQNVQSSVLEFRTHLPLFSLRAAAGGFGADEEVTDEGWVEVPEDLTLNEELFVAHVTGDSMEPLIPAESLCVFRKPRPGSRNGKIVLVQLLGTSQSGGEVTVKRYRSEKVQTDEGWQHERIIMEPLNQPKHKPWELPEGEELRVLGEFVRVL
jgi:SOS-response transcriptional repressor LexA